MFEQFISHVINMYVHHSTKWIEIEVPEVVDYFLPRKHLILMMHEEFQDAEFFESQINP